MNQHNLGSVGFLAATTISRKEAELAEAFANATRLIDEEFERDLANRRQALRQAVTAQSNVVTQELSAGIHAAQMAITRDRQKLAERMPVKEKLQKEFEQNWASDFHSEDQALVNEAIRKFPLRNSSLMIERESRKIATEIAALDEILKTMSACIDNGTARSNNAKAWRDSFERMDSFVSEMLRD